MNEYAMLCFTVMDHDVLTANDFAGEAFLALGNIPGVADYTTNVDNFHGLKLMELPLMQQTDKSMSKSFFIIIYIFNLYFPFTNFRSSDPADTGVTCRRQAGY